MGYPRVEVDLNKLEHNVKYIVNKCNSKGIKVAGVTKVFCGDPKIAKAYVDGGVSFLADSRIENLKKLKDFDIPKILLRLPMQSEAEDIVEYADVSLNSEMDTIKILSKKAVDAGKVHKIILMIDLGDLREGYFKEEEIYEAVEEILKLRGIKLEGIGTNLTCYGGIIPREDNVGKLIKVAEKIKNNYNIDLEIISGGNSSSLHLIFNDNMPEGINQLRLGESLVLGRETAFGDRIEDTFDDAFTIVVEAIELKEKPSIPIGEIGMDAFGNKPTFIDRGIRKRMICAIGKQDINLENITPVDNDIIILGGSSDHLILDVTNSKIDYSVGDKIRFKLDYGGILSSTTSEYVKRVYI
ncbi:ornithine racemase Orr [Anaerosalibacter bizertensis]|uniref:ornithine racemase Orr n=1 Tax=Anaerosalibacter bizertensis TaxID=932217 RepID=UPI001D004EB4|nr:ornithine racemase Orr [Anaerosalibacter bizertensis]MCB5559619.1 alanine/ornithine racemase family PLP-dependent enzyme [Anaerosalibacter bizertensis]MCG4583909.1 alanine/ornithine racemase family PLP-dependent enzyme [Anaerosalibacter bizertensis]